MCNNYFKSFPPSAAYVRHRIESSLFKWWLVAYTAPRHYQNQCCDILNWTLKYKLQWNFNSIQENVSENIGCEKVAILSMGKWVNDLIDL